MPTPRGARIMTMQTKTCEWCRTVFNAESSTRKYCSPACGYSAKRKPREPWPPAGDRTCGVCGAIYRARGFKQKYCSSGCREKAKYQSVRSDPDRWEQVKSNARARYVPTGRPPGSAPIHVGCAVPGCDRKHCARGLCSKHYYATRRASGETDSKGCTAAPPDLLRALVKRYDESGEFIEEPWVTTARVRVDSSLVRASCPCCNRGYMRAVSPESREFWDCGECRARVRLNQEEVEWLASGKRSMSQSPRTAS